MILDVVCAGLRNVSTVLSKLTALDIFQKLVPHLGTLKALAIGLFNNVNLHVL